jgi:hypothetical protein
VVWGAPFLIGAPNGSAIGAVNGAPLSGGVGTLAPFQLASASSPLKDGVNVGLVAEPVADVLADLLGAVAVGGRRERFGRERECAGGLAAVADADGGRVLRQVGEVVSGEVGLNLAVERVGVVRVLLA